MRAATLAPPIACPPWCALEDHEWGEGPDVWPVIAHEVTFTNTVVSILVFVEDEMTPEGVMRRDLIRWSASTSTRPPVTASAQNRRSCS